MATKSTFLIPVITLMILGDNVESFEFINTMIDLIRKISAAPNIIYAPGPNGGSPAGSYNPNGPMGQMGQIGQMGQLGQMGQMGQLGQMGQMGQLGQMGQMPGSPMQGVDPGNLGDKGYYPPGVDFSNIFQVPSPQVEKRLITKIMADALSQLDKPAPYQSDLPKLPTLGGILRAAGTFLTGIISSTIVPRDVPDFPSNNPNNYNYNPYSGPNTGINNNEAMKIIATMMSMMPMLHQNMQMQNQMRMQPANVPRKPMAPKASTDSSKTSKNTDSLKTVKNFTNADAIKPIRNSGLYVKNTDTLKNNKNIEPQKKMQYAAVKQPTNSKIINVTPAEPQKSVQNSESLKNKNAEATKNIKNTGLQNTMINPQYPNNFMNANPLMTNYHNTQPNYGNTQPNYGNTQPNYGNIQPNFGNFQPNYQNAQAVSNAQMPSPWEMMFRSLHNLQAAAYPNNGRRAGGCGGSGSLGFMGK